MRGSCVEAPALIRFTQLNAAATCTVFVLDLAKHVTDIACGNIQRPRHILRRHRRIDYQQNRLNACSQRVNGRQLSRRSRRGLHGLLGWSGTGFAHARQITQPPAPGANWPGANQLLAPARPSPRPTKPSRNASPNSQPQPPTPSSPPPRRPGPRPARSRPRGFPPAPPPAPHRSPWLGRAPAAPGTARQPPWTRGTPRSAA